MARCGRNSVPVFCKFLQQGVFFAGEPASAHLEPPSSEWRRKKPQYPKRIGQKQRKPINLIGQAQEQAGADAGPPLSVTGIRSQPRPHRKSQRARPLPAAPVVSRPPVQPSTFAVAAVAKLDIHTVGRGRRRWPMVAHGVTAPPIAESEVVWFGDTSPEIVLEERRLQHVRSRRPPTG